jgi:heat-inducible transcriptional repressor
MNRPALDDRARDILNSLIRLHIDSGEPIGSGNLAKSLRSALSPATVRNVMAELERNGYLDHPHTSAGRVPTDEGYRAYVDSLPSPTPMLPKDVAAIEAALRDRESPARVLEGASQILSRLSHQVGFVLGPELSRTSFLKIDFVRLGPARILTVMVSYSGIVNQKLVEMEEDLSQDVLQACANYLNTHFPGKPLGEIRQRLIELMQEEKTLYDSLLKAVVAVGCEAFAGEPAEGSLYLEGTGNILDQPAFADLDRMKALFRTFEEKSRLVRILNACISGEGLRVVIGHENPHKDLSQLAVVTRSCEVEGDTSVGIGVMGSTCMEYERMMALVDHVARAVREALMELRP